MARSIKSHSAKREQIAALQMPQVVPRIVEAVDVVDSQAIDIAPCDEIERQPMNHFEHLRLLGADGGELADIEKPPVIDLVGRGFPMRQAINLRVEQFIEPVEAARIVDRAVPLLEILLDERGDVRASETSVAAGGS